MVEAHVVTRVKQGRQEIGKSYPTTRDEATLCTCSSPISSSIAAASPLALWTRRVTDIVCGGKNTQTLNSDFNAMKEAVEAVETTKDEYVTSFSQQLEAEVEAINKEAKAIRNAAQVEMVLDINADQEEVLAFCAGLYEKLNVQIEGSKRIAKFQKLFKVRRFSSNT
jgi:hypothetical protein